jgi:hypothetical protein
VRRLDEWLLVAALCVALAAATAALVGSGRDGGAGERDAGAGPSLGAGWPARVAWGRP